MQITVRECAALVGLTPMAIYKQIERDEKYGSLFDKVANVWLAEKSDIQFMLEQRPAPVTRDHYIKVPVSKEEKAKLEAIKGSMPMTDFLRSLFMESL